MTDPLFCATADEVLSHLNEAQRLASEAAYPDVGGAYQQSITAQLDAATAAVQSGRSQLDMYTGTIQTCQQSAASLAQTIDSLTPGLIGYETFQFNRQGYLTGIQELSSRLSTLAASTPYSSYPQAVAQFSEAQSLLASSADKINAVIDLASFIVGKDAIDTTLIAAADAIAGATVPNGGKLTKPCL